MSLSGWLKVSNTGDLSAVRAALRDQANEISDLYKELAQARKDTPKENSLQRVDINTGATYIVGVYTAQSANYNILGSDYIVFGTTGGGGITVTLPATIPIGQQYIIQKIDAGAGALTIARNGNNINGAAADKTIGTQWNGAIILGQSSTNWTAMSLPVLP